MASASSVLTKAHTALLWCGGAYVVFLLAVTIPSVQRSFIYLHHIKFPWRADFAHPETFGFAPGKVLPLTLTTPDGAVLGAWQMLPDDIYNAYVDKHGFPDGPLPEEVFDAALKSESHPTVLYQHGNAATRAASNRVRVAGFMTQANFNFLIYDYRGFADSTDFPPPSELGLIADARAAWDYLTLEKGVSPSQVAVMGQSLGTGVTAGLVATLAEEGLTPRTVILVAPFSSIPTLLQSYRLGNIIPVLAPFASWPWAMDMFLRVLETRFNTKSIIHKMQCPILILHAQNDDVIPHSHSSDLFHSLLSTSSPSSSPSLIPVEETPAGGWGVIRRFVRPGVNGDVVWAEAVRGAHNEIGTSQLSVKLIVEAVRRG